MPRVTETVKYSLRGREGVAAFLQMQASASIPDPDGFRLDMHAEPLVEATVLESRATPMRNGYVPGHAYADEEPSVYVNYLPAGQSVGHQDGHTYRSGPGLVWIYDNARPWDNVSAEPFRLLSLHLPIALLPESSQNVLRLVSATAFGPHALTYSFASLCESVLNDPPDVGSASARAIEAALVSVVHGMIQHEDPKEVGHRVFDYSRLVAAIDDELDNDFLTAASLAPKVRMTERQIEALALIHVTTFRDLVLERRLNRLAAALRADRESPIGDVAERNGYSPRAALRQFQRSFGMSMRDYRMLSR
ncbi:helix-turn-helix transcriptional regulator [Microbacteriaceae bacterium VKM Ac-2854]|nr:helix-turn-helix transcriptional regulator [Microbacteriaceae bacterium VKM Ac-2854]